MKALVDGKEKTYRAKQFLVATGRKPNTSDSGLQKLVVNFGKRGEIVVDDEMKIDCMVVPHAIFTAPQLAGVGLTDGQAIEKGIKCKCNTVSMELVPKALAIKNTKGAVKMVVNAETYEITGIHILAPEAADLIHEGVMIVKNRMKIDDVINTLHIFPTLSEAIKIAAQSFRRDITKMSCCVK